MRSSSFVVLYSWQSCSLCISQSAAATAAARAGGVEDFHRKGGSDMKDRGCHCLRATSALLSEAFSSASVHFNFRMSAYLLGMEMRRVEERWVSIEMANCARSI